MTAEPPQDGSHPAATPDSSGRRAMDRTAARAACGFGGLGGVLFGFFAVRLRTGMNVLSGDGRVFIVAAFWAAIVVGLLLLGGAATLWMRTLTGQVLVIVGSSLAFAFTVSYSVYNYFHGPETYGRGDIGMVMVQVLLGVVPALAALLCAAAAPSRTANGGALRNGSTDQSHGR